MTPRPTFAARAVRTWPLLLCLACGEPAAEGPRLRLPDRPDDAPGGALVARSVRSLDVADREDRLVAQVARGNVPGWLRRLRPVEISGDVDGVVHEVTFWVTPDYVAVGSDDDYFLAPLSSQAAQRIADLVGGSLPTPRMVDAIWASAEVRLAPIRLDPGEDMTTVAYFERHDNLIKSQLRLHRVKPGAFVAGHKLDLVLTPTLAKNPGKAALYGWHRPDGRPIQQLFTIHLDSEVTFSEGVRLVDRRVLVDGAERDLWDVLADSALAPVLSRQGVIAEPRYPMWDEER